MRSAVAAQKHAVSETRWLWVDVDQPGQLHALWAFLAARPCHLLVESGGSGGAHAYWKLAEPLPATRIIEAGGELVEPIERANLRIVHRLGVGADGKPNVADPACAERSRVMRLAGTVNGKTGAHARIVEADFELPPYPVKQLVGDLPDPAVQTARRASRDGASTDPYKRISPPEYFEQLAGIVVPRNGLVSCPVPGHADRHPSCSVGADPGSGWCRHSGRSKMKTSALTRVRRRNARELSPRRSRSPPKGCESRSSTTAANAPGTISGVHCARSLSGSGSRTSNSSR